MTITGNLGLALMPPPHAILLSHLQLPIAGEGTWALGPQCWSHLSGSGGGNASTTENKWQSGEFICGSQTDVPPDTHTHPQIQSTSQAFLVWHERHLVVYRWEFQVMFSGSQRTGIHTRGKGKTTR